MTERLVFSCPRISSTSILSRLDAGCCVVTANKRLSRELHDQFARFKSDSGSAVWDTPAVMPFESWLHQLWQAYTADNHAAPREAVLAPQQVKALWRSIIQQDITENDSDSQPLWSVEATTRAVIQAWQIACRWEISIENCARFHAPDYRKFAGWASEYERTCRENRWVDFYTLAPAVIKQTSVNPNFFSAIEHEFLSAGIVLAGFDLLTPQQQRLFSELQRLGIAIELVEDVEICQPAPVRFRFETEQEEWLAAARWARNLIEKESCSRIAIVVPNLRQSRNVIENAVSQTLSPGSLSDYLAHQPVFHIALGKPLASYALVRNAIKLLEFSAGQSVESSRIPDILLSPFILGADSEGLQRARLDILLTPVLPFRVNIFQLLSGIEKTSSAESVPLMTKIFQEVLQTRQNQQGVELFSHWTEHFLDCLDVIGFPGQESLNSDEYQVYEAFKNELEKMGSLDIVMPGCDVLGALEILKSGLMEKRFEVEAVNPLVEVLDVPESAGQRFDAIWFGGMTSEHWPAMTASNPFIPAELQRQAGYPGASVESNLQLCAEQQARLGKQASQIVLSYHTHDGDVALVPSPFLSTEFENGLGMEIMDGPVPDSLFMHLKAGQPAMESYTDESGLAHPGGKTAGGTRLIENQAACAFRAYAEHRLGCRSNDRRQQGMDAMDRGQLIHAVLEDCWHNIRTSKKLRELEPLELQNLISASIQRRSKRYISHSGCERGFFDLHSRWLEQFLAKWFETEKIRNLEFGVAGEEISTTLDLGGLELTFKLDRIDLLSDGTICMLDYKTGAASGLGKWIGDRPEYPQLALYSLTVETLQAVTGQKPLSALIVAQLKPGETRFSGVSFGEPFLQEGSSRSSVPKLEDSKLDDALKDPAALRRHWLDSLTALAGEYRNGFASVNPLDENTCQYCTLHSFCRINQKQAS